VDALAIEPAAGDGAFLVPMVERLVESCRKLGRSLSECQHSLIAYEIDEESAARARAVTQNILMNCGVKHPLAKRLAKAWILTRDYLFDADCRQADFIIGNPPYVRLEDIPEETASVYRSAYPTMRGRADLYVAFFEAALRQLKIGGVCAFICADRWMRNQYGAELRQLITSAYSVEILLSMHQANAFDEEVDAYPAITVIRHTTQQSTVVASADQDAENIQSRRLAATLQTIGRDRLPQGIHRAVAGSWGAVEDRRRWPCDRGGC
jgi:adenine-specific DNA-methyltransferase